MLADAQFALCDAIIDSMRLEVGEKTQAEIDKLRAENPGMSVSETMGEFNWPVIKEKVKKPPAEKDITPQQDALMYKR